MSTFHAPPPPLKYLTMYLISWSFGLMESIKYTLSVLSKVSGTLNTGIEDPREVLYLRLEK